MRIRHPVVTFDSADLAARVAVQLSPHPQTHDRGAADHRSA